MSCHVMSCHVMQCNTMQCNATCIVWYGMYVCTNLHNCVMYCCYLLLSSLSVSFCHDCPSLGRNAAPGMHGDATKCISSLVASCCALGRRFVWHAWHFVRMTALVWGRRGICWQEMYFLRGRRGASWESGRFRVNAFGQMRGGLVGVGHLGASRCTLLHQATTASCLLLPAVAPIQDPVAPPFHMWCLQPKSLWTLMNF
jgi:hypothetical protein